MKNRILQKTKKIIGLTAALLLAVTLSFGQYTSTRIAGGASVPLGLPATSAAAYNIGSPGPIAVAPNGDMAWSDYYGGNGLIFWDEETDMISQLVAQGSSNSGFGGQASDATLGNRIMGVAFDSDNNVYFSVDHQVLMVDMSTGVIDLVAGSGNTGTPDFSLPALEIDLPGAAGIAWNDDDSKLYINILGRHMVGEMDAATGEIKRIVGTGVRGDDGTTGLGIEKDTREPFGLDYIKDADGNEFLYIATQQKRVHKYNIQTGIRSLLAGNGGWGYSGDGGLAVDAQLKQPHDITATNTAVYFGEHQANVVRKVDLRTGIIDKFAGTNEWGDELAGNDGPADEAILLRPVGTDFDGNGDLIIAERTAGLIRKVDMTTNIISVLTGDATVPPLPSVSDDPPPQGTDLSVDARAVVSWGDEVYFFDNISKTIVKVATDGSASIYAGVEGESDFNGGGAIDTAHFGEFTSMILDSNGDIFASDIAHNVIYKIDVSEGVVSVVAGIGGLSGYDETQEGGPATEALLKGPSGVAFNAAETKLYINDRANFLIRVVDMTTGNIDLYSGSGNKGEVTESTALLDAKYQDNRGITVDDDGNVYVVSRRFKKVFKLDGTNVDVFATGFDLPWDILFADGLLWVSDNGVIRTIDPATAEVSIVNNDVPGSWSLWPATGKIHVAATGNGLYTIEVDPASTLATIQGYADANDASALTIDMLDEFGAATIDLNLDAYQAAVADSTAATLPNISSVQMLVSDVNEQESDIVIAAVDGMAVDNDASALTLDQLTIANVSNVVDANLSTYQTMIADSTDVADKAALQAIIDGGNVNVALSEINAMATGDDASALTNTLILKAGADPANLMQHMTYDYLSDYKAAIEAATGVATVDELNTILTDVNTEAETLKTSLSLGEIDAMATANDASGLTFEMIYLAGADIDAVNHDYLAYYKAGVADAADVADVAALDAIIAAANEAGDVAEAALAIAAINNMAVSNDASELSTALLEAAGTEGLSVTMDHFEAYRTGIEAEDGIADLAALQVVIDAANIQVAIEKIVGYADAGDAGELTNDLLVAAGVDPASIVPTNLEEYKAAVANSTGTDVDDAAELQTLIEDVNEQVTTDAVAAIQQMATDGDAEGLTADLLTAAGMDFDPGYLDAYIVAVANAGSLADAAAIQDLLNETTTCETVREMPGTNDAMDLTTEMLNSLGVDNVFDANLEDYQLAVFDADTVENCGASLQTIVDETNFSVIQNMAVDGDAADLTEEMLLAVGATDVRTAKMDDYKTAIEDESDIADLAALQAIIDAVNVVSVETFGKDAISIYPNPSNGEFTIRVATGKANMKIVDITGRVVMERELIHSMNSIDLSHESKGVYFIQLENEGKLINTKMVLR